MLHATLSSHKGPVHVARYAKGSAKHVLTGGQDRTVRLWNPQLGTEIKVFQAHGYEVLSIAVLACPLILRRRFRMIYCFFSAHDNSKFLSSGGDRSVFLWDVATGVTSRRIPGHTSKIFAVDFNQDATVCASGMLILLTGPVQSPCLSHRFV
jgi:mitogen-activated protein kinase organizer 1